MSISTSFLEKLKGSEVNSAPPPALHAAPRLIQVAPACVDISKSTWAFWFWGKCSDQFFRGSKWHYKWLGGILLPYPNLAFIVADLVQMRGNMRRERKIEATWPDHLMLLLLASMSRLAGCVTNIWINVSSRSEAGTGNPTSWAAHRPPPDPCILMTPGLMLHL